MELQKFNRALVSALLVSGTMGFATQAHALDFNVDPSFLPQVSAVPSGMELVYKADYDSMGAVEELDGNAWNLYTSAFTGASGEPSGATITWDAGAMAYIACPDCYLVVKDGAANTPPEYIFDIGAWNGQDTLVLSDFWTGQGAISYVAIYNNAAGGGGGGTITPVPEADTYAMLLAGLGLVGFAARRKLSKTV